MTAHRAFQFCLQYKRTTEFRRLCEILRNHLTNLNKYRDQRDRPDLTQPESLQLYLETRFEQLKIATELELWQVRFPGTNILQDAPVRLNCTHVIRHTSCCESSLVAMALLSAIVSWLQGDHLG